MKPPSLQALLRTVLRGQDKPAAFVLAGHNGSGKSTLWYERLAPELKIPLVNADRLTLSILPEATRDVDGAPTLPAWAQRLRDTDERWQTVSQSGVRLFKEVIMNAGLPFACETVFSHWKERPDGTFESKIDDLREMRKAGYFVVLIFVGLSGPSLSVLRVQTRKALGGHDVPLDKLQERFPRTQLAIRQATAVADLTLMVDNSLPLNQAFQFVRAQRQRHVLYDIRNPAYDQSPDVLAASQPWLEKVAGPFVSQRRRLSAAGLVVSRPPVKRTRREHLEELNRQLQADPDFEPDMRFVPSPTGATPEEANGYEWECDLETADKRALFIRIAQRVNGGSIVQG